MAALRTFFALELGEAARRRAADLAAALRAAPGGERVRWVREESLHVTLRFLGATEPETLPGLLRCAGEAIGEAKPFELGLGGWLALPSPRRPRVFALGLEPAEPLAGLAADLERAAVAAGWPPEPRPFRGHVTLGRLRSGRKSPDLPAAVTGSVTADRHAWEVREVVLFQSQLRPDGARYAPLERIPLHP